MVLFMGVIFARIGFEQVAHFKLKAPEQSAGPWAVRRRHFN